ncbi:MAG TPA: hypothetical protein VFN77_09880, partial [Acetobacteraceae bacterium]|nr:hypothetical protein [Acetobacteraceae bacterium]
MRRRGRISTPDRGPRLPWILAGLVMVVGIAVLALPPVLSADYHRAAIEALASRLTGRSVTIKGRISLSLVPAPQIIADRVRIGSPRGGRISAKSLRLELAPRALLLGELRPTRVTLHAPEIVLPWPLPGGASSILPPPWLISLHAKIEDGTIALGELVFEHADLSIFIGGRHGVLAASGTGQIFGAPVDARLNIGGADDAGLTPVEAGISTASRGQPGQGADLDFKGSVSRSSVLVGALAGYAPASAVRAFRLGHALPDAPLRFTAKAQASRTRINLTALDLAAGDARLHGDAGINLTTGLPRLVVHGHGIDLSPILALLGQGEGIPMRVRADLAASRLDGFAFGRIGGDFRVSPDRTDIRSLTGSLPGGGTFSLRGALRKGGALDGRFSLADPAPPLLFSTLSAGPLPALSALPPITAPLDMRGEIHLRGQGGHVRLARLRGGIGAGKGAARFTGGIVIARHGQGKAQSLRLAVSLDFARLDVTPLLRLARAPPPLGPVTAEIALTARQARIGPAWMRDFLLDARMRHGIMVRALDFHAGRTMVTLRGARAASGAITQARLLVAGPDAGSALALLPVALPAGLRAGKLLKSPFAAELAASGPPGKLAAAAVLHLGGARIEASPIIDLGNFTASGPLSLRAPYAAGVLRSLGYKAGMDWPGPGSIGLRADFSAAPHHFELPNFVLSLGALTTSGRLILDGRG